MTGAGLRIIAGRLKGRRLRVPAVEAVRPTPERVREALFSILASRALDAVVLDAFAGTGALGFEALSRGAARVVFVESNRRVAAALRASASDLGVQDACVVVEGALPGVSTGSRGSLAGPFDLILADPPYAAGPEERQRVLVVLSRILDPDGVLVLERAARDAPVQAAGLDLERSERYGNTAVDLYRCASEGGDRPPGGLRDSRG